MIFVLVLIVYVVTLCPTIYVGDSGELIAAASCLGSTHPTGYPLYLLLVKGFSLVVPVGSFALRANLFSAVCAAAAAEVMYRTARRLVGGRGVPGAVALTFAFVGPIWTQATIARTYALAALFSAGALWCMVRWWKDGEPRWWIRHNLWLGFGLANHPMVIAHLPAFAALVLLHRPADVKRWRPLTASVVALLPGLLLYLYLPLRAPADPPAEYHVAAREAGGISDLSSPVALWDYLSRRTHHGHRWVEGAADYGRIAWHHAKGVARELHVTGLPFLLIGLGVLAVRRRSLLAALALVVLVNLGILAWHGAWWDIFLYPRYLTTAWVALMLPVAQGLASARAWLASPLGPAAAVVALLPPLFLLGWNFERCDRRGHYLAEDWGRALLAELPERAQILSMADNSIYPMMALQVVDGVRSDVGVVNQSQLHGESELILAANPRRVRELGGRPPRPTFATDLSVPPGTAFAHYRSGLSYQVVLRGQPPPQPLPPFEVPTVRGLDGSVYLDEISASLAALIHAHVADALAVRGRAEEARQHLERVAAIDAGRTWGYFVAVQTALRLQDFELVRDIATRALTQGDPRDAGRPYLERMRDGSAAMLEAHRLRESEPGPSLRAYGRAALLFELPALDKQAALQLVDFARNLQDESQRRVLLLQARDLTERARRSLPDDLELSRLAAEIQRLLP